MSCHPELTLRRLLAIQYLRCQVGGNFSLPSITVGEELVLVVEQLDTRLRRELKVGALNNGVYWARFLAKSAVNALGHINIVTRRAARAIRAGLGLNGNGTGRADGFTKLAGNATLLTGFVATESVLTTETGRESSLLKGIIDRGRFLQIVAERNPQALEELGDEVILGGVVPVDELLPGFGDHGLLWLRNYNHITNVRITPNACCGRKGKMKGEEE
jgi:hypothetical protein